MSYGLYGIERQISYGIAYMFMFSFLLPKNIFREYFWHVVKKGMTKLHYTIVIMNGPTEEITFASERPITRKEIFAITNVIFWCKKINNLVRTRALEKKPYKCTWNNITFTHKKKSILVSILFYIISVNYLSKCYL